ncbi:MAG: MFS transporter [Bacteroidales bacterium]
MESEATKNTVSKSVALFVTTLSSFLTTFMASSINIALPAIGKEFAINAVMLSWIPMSYLLTAAIFLVPFGKIADIYGRKKVYTYGIIVYSFTSFISAIAPNEMVLIAARSIQGIGGAMIFGTAIAILTSVFPANERGKAIGYNLAATYLGLSLGPSFGGFLTYQFGWRSIFAANVFFSFCIIPFILWKLKAEWAEAKGEKLDIKGSIVYMIGLFGIMYGFSILPSITGALLLGAGIIVIMFFIKLEHRAAYPVLDLSHFKRNTVFIFSNLAAFINYSATFAVGYLLSLYLQYVKGLNPQDTGIIMVTQPITMAVFSPLAGRLSDKIEPQIVASIGMGLTVVSLILFIFLGYNTSVIYIIAALIVIGIGLALFSSPNNNAIMGSVDRKYYGVASASIGTMRLTGQTISMGIATLVFAINIGKVKISPEYYPQFLDSTRIAFIIFTVLCTAGVFASMARGKLR